MPGFGLGLGLALGGGDPFGALTAGVSSAAYAAALREAGATGIATNFQTGSYFRTGSPVAPSVTRASPGYAQTLGGVLVPFGSGVLRRTDRGALIENQGVFRGLWSRDLTSAAWVKTNATVSRNQIGADLTANAACRVTATAPNATVLQAVTHASAARAVQIWVRRVTGSGPVEITVDGGATWTAATVTAAYTRGAALQTLANPNFGLRIVTSGDAVDVDFLCLEDGASVSSPVETGATTVTRASDDVSFGGLALGNVPLTFFFEWEQPAVAPAAAAPAALAHTVNESANRISPRTISRTLDAVSSGGVSSVASGNAGSTPTAGQIVRYALRVAANDFRAAQLGALGAADTSVTVPVSLDVLRVGRLEGASLFANTYIRSVGAFPRGGPDAGLQAVST
jgi:hypothetical protein